MLLCVTGCEMLRFFQHLEEDGLPEIVQQRDRKTERVKVDVELESVPVLDGPRKEGGEMVREKESERDREREFCYYIR